MKNFKKLFSIAASVLMLASMVPVATLGATTYSSELQGAYNYAYGIGVTTQPTIDAANMYGSLTRVDMAKMMSNYAIEVLGKTPMTTAMCNFTDVANQTTEMQGYITKACQLGLMGVGLTAFDPSGVVTTAQFGTVLARALYGTEYNGGTPYYAASLNALQAAGIMNNISTPNAPEIRGYVMLMMQRAAANNSNSSTGSNVAICSTPENQLSCSLGLSTCPAQCATVTVKAGNLNVSAVAGPSTSVPLGIAKAGTFTFSAGSQDVALNSVTIARQ